MDRRSITINPVEHALEKYESKMNMIRRRFARKSVFTTFILDPAVNPKLFELFFIYYSGLGKAVTEPARNWINRSADRCGELGFRELGESLFSIGNHEAGRMPLMFKDIRTLVARWNGRFSPKLDAEEIVSSTNALGVRTYTQLREDVTISDMPFLQMAIEYEIERLSAEYGKQWIDQCSLKLVSDAPSPIDLENERKISGSNRTVLHQEQIESLIKSHPEYTSNLIETGEAALEAFDLFIGDCLIIAMAHSSQYI